MMNREKMQKLAEEIDALKDTGHELDGFTRVDVAIAKDLKAVVVLEMPHELLADISVAAREAGEDVNEFMLKAAIARVQQVAAKRKTRKKASA